MSIKVKEPCTWEISWPLLRCASYETGLAIKAIPAEREMSEPPLLDFICSAEKFPSMMKVRMSSSLKAS
jgi:hypothetical protein